MSQVFIQMNLGTTVSTIMKPIITSKITQLHWNEKLTNN
jgi:hypothetical protein